MTSLQCNNIPFALKLMQWANKKGRELDPIIFQKKTKLNNIIYIYIQYIINYNMDINDIL